MVLDIPSGRVLPVETATLRLDPRPHALEVAETAAIDANWLREKERRPAIYDGRMALFSALTWRDGVLAGTCHMVRYATFLFWRAGHRREMARHLYAHAVLVAADGPLVAVRMGGHTLNAGRVYFAAGSLEPDDFTDGIADLDANMRREVLEETGLDLAEMRPEPALQALAMESGTVVFRRYHCSLTASEIEERVAAHVASEAEPEIDGAVIIREARADYLDLTSQMRGILDWHFGEAGA